MRFIHHPAGNRGQADHGWLIARHSFSFAAYYDPMNIQFGKLRVLNDDLIRGGSGFGTHPHDNMEIVTIPLSGSLAHRDSMGNGSTISPGEVQVMSAGKGITHSEFNASASEEANILQIWVFPKLRDIEPRYGQLRYGEFPRNELKVVISPAKSQDTLWLNQDTWFSIGSLDKDFEHIYPLHDASNGLYLFLIEGKIHVEGQQLGARDGAGFWETDKVRVRGLENSRVLAIEVPM